MGYDFQFGYQRKSDAILLKQLGNTLGFSVNIVAPTLYDGQPISSSRIHEALQDGKVALARACLDRHNQRETSFEKTAMSNWIGYEMSIWIKR
ncbi:MAG: hypothetical protein GYA34_18425 [Chloroflexi bacterium]|nr:hypothetical protein [Chloroflexota bacterium]